MENETISTEPTETAASPVDAPAAEPVAENAAPAQSDVAPVPVGPDDRDYSEVAETPAEPSPEPSPEPAPEPVVETPAEPMAPVVQSDVAPTTVAVPGELVRDYSAQTGPDSEPVALDPATPPASHAVEGIVAWLSGMVGEVHDFVKREYEAAGHEGEIAIEHAERYVLDILQQLGAKYSH